MNKLIRFLQWQFKDCYKSVQFWAFSLVLISIVAQLGSCPEPIPLYMSIAGLAVSLADSVIWFIKMQYLEYTNEKNRIASELSKK